MLLVCLIINPIIGLISLFIQKDNKVSSLNIKLVALILSTLNFISSYTFFIMFDFSTNQFQFVQESLNYYELNIGLDGLSIYFVLLTTLILPISLLSNWKSIDNKIISYVATILLLELFLLIIFMILDVLSFYVFFESILPPATWLGKSYIDVNPLYSLPVFIKGYKNGDHKARSMFKLSFYTPTKSRIRP